MLFYLKPNLFHSIWGCYLSRILLVLDVMLSLNMKIENKGYVSKEPSQRQLPILCRNQYKHIRFISLIFLNTHKVVTDYVL